MNQTLKQSKQGIRAFIRAHWSDQKVIEVYAFNRDGKMFASDYCSCIRGVTLSDTLHQIETRHCYTGHDPDHYRKTERLAGAQIAEIAYIDLGLPCHSDSWPSESRQRRLSAILRAEMRRRERTRMIAVEEAGELVAR